MSSLIFTTFSLITRKSDAFFAAEHKTLSKLFYEMLPQEISQLGGKAIFSQIKQIEKCNVIERHFREMDGSV